MLPKSIDEMKELIESQLDAVSSTKNRTSAYVSKIFWFCEIVVSIMWNFKSSFARIKIIALARFPSNNICFHTYIISILSTARVATINYFTFPAFLLAHRAKTGKHCFAQASQVVKTFLLFKFELFFLFTSADPRASKT
jgi:hypothetical protein